MKIYKEKKNITFIASGATYFNEISFKNIYLKEKHNFDHSWL